MTEQRVIPVELLDALMEDDPLVFELYIESLRVHNDHLMGGGSGPTWVELEARYIDSKMQYPGRKAYIVYVKT